MNRSLMITLSSGVLYVAALCVFSLPVSGQTPAEIENLAWIIHDFASEKRKGALKD